VVYLYPTVQAAEEGKQIGGTGFMVGIQLEPHCYVLRCLVTNRHVIELNCCVASLNDKNGNRASLNLRPQDWIGADDDDLAVCPLPFDEGNLHYRYVTDDKFIPPEMLGDGRPFGLGTDTFMVGRFINHDGVQRNTPTVRFGNIAQMPADPVKVTGGLLQEGILIETRSISGYSGSPVFAVILPWTLDESKALAPGTELCGLLGVQCAYLNHRQSVMIGDNPVEDGSYLLSNTGLAVVVPAWKLSMLLQHERIQATKAQAQQKLDFFRKERPQEAARHEANLKPKTKIGVLTRAKRSPEEVA
jgi:hypothetical protein